MTTATASHAEAVDAVLDRAFGDGGEGRSGPIFRDLEDLITRVQNDVMDALEVPEYDPVAGPIFPMFQQAGDRAIAACELVIRGAMIDASRRYGKTVAS